MVNKKLSICLTFLTLISFWFVNNTWKYSSVDDIPVLKQSDLIFSNIAKTYIVNGNVIGSSVFGKDIHSYRIVSTDQDIEVNSTIWPGIGRYAHPSTNNSVEIIGALSKYNGIWQINSLSSNHIKPQKSESVADKQVELSKALILNGENVNNIGPLNILLKEQRAKSGALNLSLLIFDSSAIVEGIMFEKNWRDKGIVENIGDEVLSINAFIGEYRGSVSLTVNSVNLLSSNVSLSKIDMLKKHAITLKQSLKYKESGKLLVIGPLKSVSTNTTRTGEHLQFKVEQANQIVSGIMFNFDKKSQKILNSSRSFYLVGKVTDYRGSVSLQSSWVVPSK